MELRKIIIGLILFGFLCVTQVQAIPSFATSEGMQCSGCHSAFPALNALGRMYREQGYSFSAEQAGEAESRNFLLDNMLPISAAVISRPYDKKGSGVTKNRAIHEVELMTGGQIGYGISAFIELEAEDETGFDAGAGIIQASYAVNRAFNVQVSRAPTLYFDPYNSYTNSRRATINRNVVIDQTFGGADNGGKLRTARQNLTVTGRPLNNLFYGVSYSGPAGDGEGHDANTMVARIAYDVTPTFMVGGMVMQGTCTVASGNATCATADRDYSRHAIDAEWTINNQLVLNAVFSQAEDDDVTGSISESNNAFYVQGFYNFLNEGRPLYTPVLRYDSYEIDNGSDRVNAWTFGLNHYIRQNIKLRLEYWNRDSAGSVATVVTDDDRLTLQIDALF